MKTLWSVFGKRLEQLIEEEQEIERRHGGFIRDQCSAHAELRRLRSLSQESDRSGRSRLQHQHALLLEQHRPRTGPSRKMESGNLIVRRRQRG